ncbi:ParB/RepB/Spo0J family partition protein [Candidatus Bathyarchaeota archaeon]|nr:ParB/RepB/Spo0J family partition protein [Candidatus Bathyarchaeota archaeon]
MSQIESLPIKGLRVSPLNVRKRVGDLADLQASIKSMGLLQPIIVREAKGNGFEVVVGQRRFLACKALGWDSIPAVKRELTDREALILSLSENVQVDSLDPIERARGIEELVRDFEREMPHTKALEEASKVVGKEARTVHDWLRLLMTTEAVQRMVQEKKIGIETGARLASLPKERQKDVAEVIYEERLPESQAVKAIEFASRRPELRSRQAIKTFLRETEEYSVTISLPGSLYQALSQLAQAKKLTIQEIIRRAVRKYLRL